MDGCWLGLPPPPTTTTTPAQFLEPDFETGCRNFLKQKKEFGQPQPNFVHFHFSVSRFNAKFGRQIIKSDQTNQMELWKSTDVVLGSSVTRCRNKKSPIFSKLAQKVATRVSTETGMFFNMAQNAASYLGYFCMKTLPLRPFKNSPIWSLCLGPTKSWHKRDRNSWTRVRHTNVQSQKWRPL